jgi:hypothetical protein
MNTISIGKKMNRLKIMQVFLIAAVLYSAPVRYELNGNFISSDYTREPHFSAGLSKPDASSDIPELFEQRIIESAKASGDSVLTDINGFRVQIFKTEDLIEAKRRESMYIENFGEENVVLIYEKPFYKIRVGRLRNREEAEDLQQALCRRGMCSSIIIPDMVRVLMPSKKQ